MEKYSGIDELREVVTHGWLGKLEVLAAAVDDVGAGNFAAFFDDFSNDREPGLVGEAFKNVSDLG